MSPSSEVFLSQSALSHNSILPIIPTIITFLLIPVLSLRLAGKRVLPCLSISLSTAAERKYLCNSLLLCPPGSAASCSTKLSHLFMGYIYKHPSRPKVMMNFSPSSSLNLEGTIILPLLSTVCSYEPVNIRTPPPFHTTS